MCVCRPEEFGWLHIRSGFVVLAPSQLLRWPLMIEGGVRKKSWRRPRLPRLGFRACFTLLRSCRRYISVRTGHFGSPCAKGRHKSFGGTRCIYAQNHYHDTSWAFDGLVDVNRNAKNIPAQGIVWRRFPQDIDFIAFALIRVRRGFPWDIWSGTPSDYIFLAWNTSYILLIVILYPLYLIFCSEWKGYHRESTLPLSQYKHDTPYRWFTIILVNRILP